MTTKPRRFSIPPWVYSVIIIAALVAWLAMGMSAEQADEPEQANENSAEVPHPKVLFESFTAVPTNKTIELYGRTAPNRSAKLGAEIAGKIVQLNAKKGERVKAGQVLALIDERDLGIQLNRAKAMLRVKEKEFNAAKSLKNKGLQGEVAFANAQAALVDAQAALTNVETAMTNTKVIAPFDGILDHHYIELGDFVGVGDPILTLIDLSTLVIEADVSERHIEQLSEGQSAEIRLLNQHNFDGVVRYIGRVSSEATNTFPIEIEIDNQQGALPAGMSAEVALALDTELAIKVTPAMLALDEQGNLGVKTLVGDHVKFVEIQLVKAEQDGVWLSGLGERVDIIVLGQGFARDGAPVSAQRVEVSSTNVSSTNKQER